MQFVIRCSFILVTMSFKIVSIINNSSMKVLVLISLVGGLMLSSCGGSSSQKNTSDQVVNAADTIYLGDLREKFAGDSIFF